MKLKSFYFGLGCGLFFLSAVIFFAYDKKINAAQNTVSYKELSDDEVKERARHLGMVTITENSANRLSGDDEIIKAARELGMVFPQETDEGDTAAQIIPETDDIQSDTDSDTDTAAQSDDDSDSGETDAAKADEQKTDAATEKNESNSKAPENAQSGSADNNQATAQKEEEKPDTAQKNEPAPDAPADENPAPDAPAESSEPKAPPENSQKPDTPAQPEQSGESNGENVTVTIANGMTARQIAQTLLEKGIIGDYDGFLHFVAQKGVASRLVIGTYTFAKNEDYAYIIDNIARK